MNSNTNEGTEQQTFDPNEYKNFFSQKFIVLFKELVGMFIRYLTNAQRTDSEEYANLLKINGLIGQLNYDKIMSKIASNTKLFDVLGFLSKMHASNSYTDVNGYGASYHNFFKNNDKFWSLMPAFEINKLLLEIDVAEHGVIYEKLNLIHICVQSYSKIIKQIEICESENKPFDPFESFNVKTSLGEQVYNINTMFKGVEPKKIEAYEMLMAQLISSEDSKKMNDCMQNIKEADVDEAASKLNEALSSENFNGTKETSEILSEMLTNIKTEVLNLKNDCTGNEGLKGKEGVEKMLGVAQKVAGSMMGKIQSSDISVLDMWDATSSLAKSTIQSDAINIIDSLIKTNIMASMNNKYQEIKSTDINQNVENTTDSQSEFLDTETSASGQGTGKRARRREKRTT